MARRELRVRGDPALFFRPLEHPFAVGIPAIIKFPPVFVCPLLENMVWPVDRAARPVHEKWLVRLERFVSVQPTDCVVCQILAEVVALLHGFWWQDARGVADQVRLILRGLAGEKAVEILEAQARRPVFERGRPA